MPGGMDGEDRVKLKPLWIGVGLLSSLGLVVLAQHEAGAATTTALASKAVQDGVYTARQADRGKDLYKSQCAACHGASLSGGTAPVLEGTAFQTKWKEKTLADLFTLIKTRMPLTKPGSLTAQQTADLIAFILQTNKYKAGNSLLPPDAKALSDIAFDKAAQAAALKAAQPAQPAQPQTTPAQGPASGPRTAAAGVFTAAQAAKGREHYIEPANACSGCHGADLGGSPGGPSLARGAFKLKWGGRTVGEMFTFIKTMMPPGRAGALEDQAYLEIVAYILQYNGFPAGTNELKLDLDDLKQITIPK